MTVDVHDLTKAFGPHFALRVPHLHVETGEAIGLVGNNGAGKTTFLRLLLDLLRADGGYVRLDGQRVDESTAWKSNLGAYLDESFLIDFLRPDEYFAFVGRTYGLAANDLGPAVTPYRDFLPESAFSADPPYIRDLSMGNKKKVGLVAAMIVAPRLLILDEPFANLDPGSQIRLKTILRRQRDLHGTTMLISSHDLGHVTDVCERIAVLDDGQIVRDTPTSAATLHELERYFAAAS